MRPVWELSPPEQERETSENHNNRLLSGKRRDCCALEITMVRRWWQDPTPTTLGCRDSKPFTIARANLRSPPRDTCDSFLQPKASGDSRTSECPRRLRRMLPSHWLLSARGQASHPRSLRFLPLPQVRRKLGQAGARVRETPACLSRAPYRALLESRDCAHFDSFRSL